MKQLYSIFILIFSTLILAGCQTEPTPQNQVITKATKIYTSTHFRIKYPATFKVRSGQNEGYFTSPDKKVTFYVYDINVSGGKSTYNKVLPTEKLLSSNSEKGGKDKDYYNYYISGWNTLKAKNGNYYRSYISTRKCNTRGKEFYGNCRYEIFGIRYKDTKAYHRYRNTFMRFKDSLREVPRKSESENNWILI